MSHEKNLLRIENNLAVPKSKHKNNVLEKYL